MTDGDRTALEALGIRLDHTASIARLVAIHTDIPADEANAIRGVAETLTELAGRMDAIINPLTKND